MKRKTTNIHHRKSRTNGGDDSAKNLAVVDKVKHQAFHQLFGDGNPKKVARILNRDWLDPEYELVVVERYTGDFNGIGISGKGFM